MSVILDALRKLDREKSSRRSGTANIAVEILKPDQSRPRKKNAQYVAAVSLTAIAAAAITYALTSGPGSMQKPAPAVSVSRPPPIAESAPAPISREPVRKAQE